MDAIATIISIIFIGLLLFCALTFGFTIIMIILATVGLASFLTVARGLFRRWRFLHEADRPVEKPPTIIEGNYSDISSTDRS